VSWRKVETCVLKGFGDGAILADLVYSEGRMRAGDRSMLGKFDGGTGIDGGPDDASDWPSCGGENEGPSAFGPGGSGLYDKRGLSPRRNGFGFGAPYVWATILRS
jgi:hypothetical protein